MFEQEIAALAIAIREAVTKHKAENHVPITRHVRIRRRDFTLRYQDNFTFANFPAERTEEDIWDLDDQMRFVDSVLTNLQEHKALVSALKADPKHSFHTDRFVRYVAFASSKGLSDAQLQKIVNALDMNLTVYR